MLSRLLACPAHLFIVQDPIKEVAPYMDDKCKWYVSALREECGDPAVRTVTAIPSRLGPVKKLAQPLPVCSVHSSHIDQLFAQLRTVGRK